MAISRSIISQARAGSDALQWATQPGLELPANLPANWRIFSCFLHHFRSGGIALQFSSDTPRNAPNSGWLVKVRAGRHWTRKSRVSADFRGILKYFCTSVDVTGRLWSWDGWPPSFRSKRLFSRVLNLSVLADAPTTAPPNVGCCRTLLDNSTFAFTGTRLTTAIYYSGAGMCRLHLTITRPHIDIHQAQYNLYGIIPYSLLIGAFQ
jgi:hypothetical protein